MQPLRVRIIPYIWSLLPSLCLLFGALLENALGERVVVTAILLFYSCIHSTRRLRYSALIALGFLVDLITGAPLALHVLLFVGFRFAVGLGLKHIEQVGFLGQWALFVLYLPVYLIVQNMLYGYYATTALPFGNLPVMWLTSLLFYPTFHMSMKWLEKTFIRRYWFVLKHA